MISIKGPNPIYLIQANEDNQPASKLEPKASNMAQEECYMAWKKPICGVTAWKQIEGEKESNFHPISKVISKQSKII